MNKIKNVAVLVSCMDEEYQNKIISGINDYAQVEEFNVYIFSAFGDGVRNPKQDVGEYNIFKLIDYRKFDGVILLTNTITSEQVKDQILEDVKRSNVCVVSVGCDLLDAYNISIDNFQAMSSMMDHFIEYHHFNRINYISGIADNNESYQRLKAYKNALTSHNIPIEEERIYHGQFRYEDGIDAIEKFLSSEIPMPQAIVCANDVMALSAIVTLTSYNFKIPQDICVSGFDRIYDARNYSPEITTVERPLYEIGRLACEKIFKHINSIPQERCDSVETRAVFTESCGCGHTENEGIDEFRARAYKMISSYREGIKSMTVMSNDLAEATSIDELLDRLKIYILSIKCEEFYLCLCENWHSSYDAELGFIDIDTDGYTKNVVCMMAYYDHEFNFNSKKFQSKNIVPNFDINDYKDGKIYYVSPIHFHEKCLGYCIIQGSEYPLKDPMFRTWLNNISTAIENIRNKISLEDVIHELDKLYVIDNLSNIYNRNGFSRSAESIYATACKSKEDIMVLFIDLDGLKYINDKFGHKEGDNAIIEVANAIKKCCTDGEVYARFGGDEFVIFSINYDEDRVKRLCNNINDEFKNYNLKSGKPYKIGASMGYHITPADTNISIHNIIDIADAKMYELKKLKRKNRRQSI